MNIDELSLPHYKVLIKKNPRCILGKEMQCNGHGEVVQRDQRMCMTCGDLHRNASAASAP
jgi:hypothetical protein